MLIKPVHGFHILPVVVVCSPDGRQQQLFDAVSTLIENRKRDCTRFLLCGSTSLSHLLPHSVSSLCLWRSTTKWLNVSCASVAVHCTPHASPKHTHTFFAMYVPCWTVGRWTASQLLHITTPEKPEHCSSSGLSSLCEPHHHRHRRLSLSVFSEFVSVCVCLLQESAVQRLNPHCLTITRQQTDQST